MSIVSDVLTIYLPAKRKSTPSGWISFNAPCCVHNGENADTKGRGGVIYEGETVSYHCFNCGYKASWQPGRNLSYKFKKLLEWLGTTDDVITKLALDVLRENEGTEARELKLQFPTFLPIQLPDNSIPIKDLKDSDLNEDNLAVLEYMSLRNLNIDDTEYYWSPSLGFKRRLIIPFYNEGTVVGYTARHVGKQTPKYLTQSQPGYVYGLDEQRPHKVFCIVSEGPIDAIHVEGCALLGSEINEQQAMLLNRLNKDIYVVPDRDSKGRQLVNQAIDHGWHVSMPDWDQSINDISDAVAKYGRLYTLYSIASAAESSALKIRLRQKKWFG